MSERYELIDGEKAHFSVALMCRVLEVSLSGYYIWRARPASATVERRRELQVHIYENFYMSGRMRYGHRRVQPDARPARDRGRPRVGARPDARPRAQPAPAASLA